MSFSKPLLWMTTTTACAGFVYIIKDRSGGLKYEGREELTDKVVIVTGANSGIGKEVALDLARRKAKVIMACRDMLKCEEARQEIVCNTMNKFVYCRPCDLASQKSIRAFVDLFKKEHSNLHILINNAGVMRTPLTHTEEGIELQIGVNHMGHFLLTNLLLDTMKNSAPARIINVSSLAHLKGSIKIFDLNSAKYYDPGEAYAQSKLANVMFTRELAKRLKDSGVTVNAVHPGIVDTNITRYMSFYSSTFSAIFLKPIIWPFIKTPRQGAQNILYTALSPELNDVSGQYFSDFQQSKVHPTACREELLEWLWNTSVKWTNLNDS